METSPSDKGQTDILSLTRAELYKRVWKEPASRLAPQLGISDVALGKTCKRLDIPTPSRGYWARLEAGQRLRKDALPAAKPNQPLTVQFHVAENLKRREEAKAVAPDDPASESWPDRLALPERDAALHPIAARLAASLNAAKPAEDGRIQIRTPNLPEVICSPALAIRVAGAVHVLAEQLEERGVIARIGKEPGAVLQFARGEDAISLRMEEEMEELEHIPTAAEKRRPSWEWQTKVRQPSGRLLIHLYSAQRIHGRKQWSETTSRPLERILPLVIARIMEVFREFVEERKREDQRRLDQIERERLWKEEEKQRHHRERLHGVTTERVQLLHRAAQWWQVHQADLEFIAACEKYWRGDRTGNSTRNKKSGWRGRGKMRMPFPR